MKRSLGRKTAALFMAAIMSVASSVCTTSMAVKAESATVTDAEEEIVDVQEEQVEQTEQTAEDEEIIDIEVMAGDIPIDSAHFPDENFRKYVSNKYIDTDGNGVLSSDEISNVHWLSLSCEGISSLQGIEYFTELKNLSCDSNNLSYLDVSKNILLEELYCDDNNLSYLDVSKNANLVRLTCSNNNLDNLDLSRNQLLGLLECSNNNLEILNISNNTNLTYLDCKKNKIVQLEFSKDTNLSYLCCEYNMIQNLDVSNCNDLSDLSCDATALRNIDLSNNRNLSFITPYIVLDSNGRYDLSQLSWIRLEKVKDIEFKYAIDSSSKYIHNLIVEADNYSYLSGNVINILNYNWGMIRFSYEDKDIGLVYDKTQKPLNENDVNPGIFVMNADRNHYVAGLATSCAPVDKTRLEYSWVAQDASGNFIQMSDWSKSEWVDWTPEKYGTYTIFAKVRVDGSEEWCYWDGREPRIYTTVGQYDYHPYIKGKCQLPCSAVNPGQPGYLIGVESYENPNQSYQFEMLILDCTLLAQGLPAWTYTTGKFTVPEGNAGWCVWNPQYGYYWTLFRIYDGAGNLIDEYCYPFVNAY